MKVKNWSNMLISATILITVVRYMGAFASSDLGKITGLLSEFTTFMLTLSGLGMGILDVLGGGLLFNGWRMTMPKTGQHWTFRFKVLTFCVFGLILSGMVILIPFTVSRMTQSSIVDSLGGDKSSWLWIWAGMVNVIPYLLIAGVFVGNRMVEGLEAEESFRKLPKVSDSPEPEQEKLPKDWRNLRPTLDLSALQNLANISPSQAKELSVKYGVDVRTVTNWKLYAQEEIRRSNPESYTQ